MGPQSTRAGFWDPSRTVSACGFHDRLGAMHIPPLSRRAWLRLAGGLAAAGWPRGTRAQSVRRAEVANGRRFLQYDVFTDRPLTGNQLAVFLDTEGLTTEAMAAMTRETNFSEATFVFPAERAGTDIRLRIFGRGGEMPFAGHPVIGSTFALADDGTIAPGSGTFTFGLNIGPTLVELEWRADRLAFAWMTQQPPVFGPTLPDAARVAAAYGLPAEALHPGLPVQEVNCGSPFFMLALKTRAAVDQAVLDTRALGAVFESAKVARRGVFVFSREPGADGATVYSRMIGAVEDPATGSASGPLGAYLVRYGLVPVDAAGTIVSAQGVKMNRASRVHIRVDATAPDRITRVRVGGTSVLVGEGRLRSA
jgi:trans-2,3-dihydro-3-hydroxyanthranilate isomerase